MSKAERLFALIELLRGRRSAMRAAELAEALGVSERTVYRDIAALIAQGIAITGAAGVGYLIDRRAHLPPLMFEPDEALALAVGLRLARAGTDPELGAAAARAEQRLRAVFDERALAALALLPYRIPVTEKGAPMRALHAQIRRAAAARLQMRLTYRDQLGVETARVVYPLALMGWGDRWTFLAHCTLRGGYRNFRVDRIAGLETLAEGFATSETLSIAHYYVSELGIDDDD